jgi:Bacteriophage tail sheath protein
MPTITTYPGVYMQEVSSGIRPIQAASTSTSAFLGVAERGPIGEVSRILNFTEFETIYGGFLADSYLSHAVFQFFNNGGSRCYVARVARDAETADITLRDRAATPQDALTVAAVSPGVWGNTLQVTVDSTGAPDPENTFNLAVYRFSPGDDAPTLLESFAGLSMNPASPSYVATVVNSRSAEIRITPNLANSNQINGFIQGTPTTGALGANQRRLRVSINGDGFQEVDLSGQAVETLAEIRTALEAAIQDLTPLRASTPPEAYGNATVTLTGAGNNQIQITSGVAGVASRVEVLDATDLLANAAGALGLRLGARVVHGSANMRPPNTAAGSFYLLGDSPVAGAVSAVTAGSDGTTPQDQDYTGAFNLLDTIRDVSLLAVPGVGSEAVAAEGMNYCRNRRPLSDCFFIADMARQDVTLADAEQWRDAITTPNSYGAVYFPWLLMLDPRGGPEPIPVPPSGYVAGLYARTDAQRGVWKSPAGVQAAVGGAVGLVTELTDNQQGDLNVHPKSVCVIRRFPASGIVLWGARTMSSDPEYNYIAVRRMAIFLRVSIFNGIQWAVFEPNDEALWGQLRVNLNAFMMILFRQGAFQGSTPSTAFFVKVDSETTTQADIDLGIVNILVGFAPLKPAEFVVVKISQKTAAAS